MSDREQKRSAAFWIATVGGIGLVPRMPGTAGSCVGVVLWYCTTLVTSPTGMLACQLLLFVVLFFLGLWSSSVTERELHRKDPSEIVIDETTGAVIPYIGMQFSVVTCITGFILFRIFDIVKPFPINRLQKVKGGWGIMIDDVAAGILSLIILHALRYYIYG
jgi:phosphatidylglycerophosphatase A